jgi:U3 small nucleolar RNA-associated protein 21
LQINYIFILIFSTVTETKNHSFGRAVFNRKLFKKVKNKRSPDVPLLMPPVINLVCEGSRAKEWDDIVALHRSLAEVTTWSSDKGRMGDHKLLHPRLVTDITINQIIFLAFCLIGKSLTQ